MPEIGALSFSINVEAKEATAALEELAAAADKARAALGLLGVTIAATSDTFGEDFEKVEESIRAGARTSKGRFKL